MAERLWFTWPRAIELAAGQGSVNIARGVLITKKCHNNVLFSKEVQLLSVQHSVFSKEDCQLISKLNSAMAMKKMAHNRELISHG